MADLGAVGETRQVKFINTVDSAYNLDISVYPIGGVLRVDDARTIFIQRRFIRGYVRNSAAVGIARRVVAISNSTRQMVAETVSSAVDGSFTLRPAASENCQVVAMPDPGDNRNAVILADITPKTT